MFSRSRVAWALFAWIAFGHAGLARETWVNPTDTWETIGPPNGSLLIHGGYHGGEGADAFLSLIDDPEALIVVIPTAGSDEDCGPDAPAALPLLDRGAKNVVVLHTRERSVANSREFTAPLRKAAAVWIEGGQQSRLAKAYLHTRTHTELFEVLERGGVVAGNSAGASIQGSFLYGGHAAGDVGFGLVRDSVFGQHYIRRRRMGGVQKIVGKSPQLLGLGLDEGAFVVVQGNMFEVFGASKVAVCDAGRPGWPGTQPYELLFPGDKYDMKSRRVLAARTWDLQDQWEDAKKPWVRREAEWKTLGPPRGSLLLTGERPSPSMAERLLDLVGNPNARFVVIPNFNGQVSNEQSEELALLKAAGAENVETWSTTDRNAANSVTFVAPLTQADAVWICGGEQWKLADAYLHTLAHRELFRLLDRGGVIAGTGGGARFLGRHMAGDNSGWNRGCGFLPAAAVHTWPGGARRTADLVATLKNNLSLLGIGIDDRTAILVQGNEFEVLGAGKVAVFDTARPGWPWSGSDEAFLLLGQGDRFDMTTRKPDW